MYAYLRVSYYYYYYYYINTIALPKKRKRKATAEDGSIKKKRGKKAADELKFDAYISTYIEIETLFFLKLLDDLRKRRRITYSRNFRINDLRVVATAIGNKFELLFDEGSLK